MPENKGQQGTGKHPHKSTEEPFPHTKKEEEQESSGGGAGTARQKEQKGGSRSQEQGSSDLKEREYRDNQGNVHHHTHTYEDQHKKEK